MGKVLALLGSGRSKGFTARLLRAAIGGVETVEGVQVDWVHVHKYDIRPCRSCFHCIRHVGDGCSQNDDMGRNGEGVLYRKVADADGLLIGDAVHNWTITAAMHLFLERMYSLGWTGKLSGTHFASISSASCSGMHRVANRTLCQQAFAFGFRYVGGLPVHVALMDEALEEARYLGRKLGLAARNGRQPVDDETLWAEYNKEVWNVYPEYMDNLTGGTMDYNDSLPERCVRHGVFRKPEAEDLLRKAADGLKEVVRLHKLGNFQEAQRCLARTAPYWVRAAWKEFLEEEVIGADTPESYHPLDEA